MCECECAEQSCNFLQRNRGECLAADLFALSTRRALQTSRKESGKQEGGSDVNKRHGGGKKVVAR